MEVKDFRKLVLDSPIKEKLESIEVVLKYEHINSEITLKGIQSIYKFVLGQVIGWNKIENIPSYLAHSKNHFENIKANLINLVSQKNNQLFDNSWNNIKKLLSSNMINVIRVNYFIFIYDSPETDFIINVNNKNSGFTQGTIDFITGQNLSIGNNPNYFNGVMVAYEFKSQGETDILQRRNSEKTSLSTIRNKYNNYIAEAEQQLNSYLSDSKENLIEHFGTIEALKKEKDKSFEDWFSESQQNFEDFYDSAQQNIAEKEDLYKEKLKLEAPAKYWSDRALKLKKEGENYMNWLIGVSVCSAIFLFVLLILLGKEFFETAFSNTVIGIKWSIILITMVSFLAFVIKILSRMAFSSFHLSRDAEEKEQLTYFYLALKKDTTIEPEERQLILQSLFSRADTGLLREDSSPTMPSNFMEKISTGK